MDQAFFLEILRLIAAPIATVVSIFVVAVQARKTFVRQKAVEKRLEWYERMHVFLDRFAKGYLEIRIAGMRKEPLQEPAERLQVLALEFSSEADKAYMYAGRAGFHAIQQLNGKLAQLHIEGVSAGFTTARITEITELCGDTAKILSVDLREELGMESLHLGKRIRDEVRQLRRLRGQ